MENTTLALAVILGAGFLLATLGRLVRLPAVTGYILAGAFLGPLGLDLVNAERLGDRLEHFNQIALMLVAFGIGEHLEFRRIGGKGRLVGVISAFEIVGAAGLVGVTTFLALSGRETASGAGVFGAVIMAMLLGAVAVATAPAATLLVVRESQAAGKLSSTLLQVVALDNVAAIVLFGFARSFAHGFLGEGRAVLPALGAGLVAVPLALLLGVLTGLAMDFIVHRIERRGDMLTAGLALLLLCGEGARMAGLSPLLAGMAAGCTIVNRDHRDVRIFRAINAFEPPIYVLFFTLAGSHLDASVLKLAGVLGLLYFLSRAVGKTAGAWLGGYLAGAAPRIRRYLGMSLVPQAGLAIGLLLLVEADTALGSVAGIMTPVVLTGILFAELLGPVLIRYAMVSSGEAAVAAETESDRLSGWTSICDLDGEGACRLVPWNWPRLTAVHAPRGSVLVGASHLATVAGLTRMGAVVAHHLQARLVVAHVVDAGKASPEAGRIVRGAREAAAELGYPVRTALVRAALPREGIVGCAREENSRIILLGCPLEGSDQGFQEVVESVARGAPCQVAVVRFSGTLHTERILVPFADLQEVEELEPILAALAAVGNHRITMLWLFQAETPRPKLLRAEKRLAYWARSRNIRAPFRFDAVAAEARLQAVVEAARDQDFIIMAASKALGIKRYFFGSLATDVARRCRKPMMLVHTVDVEPAHAAGPEDEGQG